MNSKLNNLIARVLSGNATERDRQDLETWMSQREENRREFERARRVWEVSESLKKNSDTDVDAAWNDLQARIEKSGAVVPVRKNFGLRIAAGFIVIALLASIIVAVLRDNTTNESIAEFKNGPQSITNLPEQFDFDTLALEEDSLLLDTPDTSLPTKPAAPKLRRKAARNVVMITYSTRDTARAFYLPDNSIVFLNEHSTVTYANDFGNRDRQISLQGEAYFEPVVDSLPFIVTCANSNAETQQGFFNLRQNQANKTVELITVSGAVNFTAVGNKRQYKSLVINQGERGQVSDKNELVKETNKQKDYKWWQKKNLRAKLRSLVDKIKNVFK